MGHSTRLRGDRPSLNVMWKRLESPSTRHSLLTLIVPPPASALPPLNNTAHGKRAPTEAALQKRQNQPHRDQGFHAGNGDAEIQATHDVGRLGLGLFAGQCGSPCTLSALKTSRMGRGFVPIQDSVFIAIYFGGCSSLLSQPFTCSIFGGSGRSQSKHGNVRCPLPPGGSCGLGSLQRKARAAPRDQPYGQHPLMSFPQRLFRWLQSGGRKPFLYVGGGFCLSRPANKLLALNPMRGASGFLAQALCLFFQALV
jgi:hypothetical protein